MCACLIGFSAAGDPLCAQTLQSPANGPPGARISDDFTSEEIVSEESASDVDVEGMLDLQPVIIESEMIEFESDLGVPPSDDSDVVVEAVCCEDVDPLIGFGDWVGYNATQSNTTWLAGGDFGMFSMESYPALKIGTDSALLFGSGFHFLDGPRSPDMPPRLFDFQLAYQARKKLTSDTMLDVRLGVGVFSDFEGSARKGVRFPGHMVVYRDVHHSLATVLGVEVLDRDDISVLPVAGLIFRPLDDLVVEAVFPRPRIQLKLSKNRAMYFGGELGGGTWAIKRDSSFNDNATYRDLRVTWGIAAFEDDNDSVMEIGWAFDRSLDYRSGLGDTDLDGAFILRWHKHY